MLRLIAFRSFGDGAEGTHVFVPAQGCQALWAYQSFCARAFRRYETWL